MIIITLNLNWFVVILFYFPEHIIYFYVLTLVFPGEPVKKSLFHKTFKGELQNTLLEGQSCSWI